MLCIAPSIAWLSASVLSFKFAGVLEVHPFINEVIKSNILAYCQYRSGTFSLCYAKTPFRVYWASVLKIFNLSVSELINTLNPAPSWAGNIERVCAFTRSCAFTHWRLMTLSHYERRTSKATFTWQHCHRNLLLSERVISPHVTFPLTWALPVSTEIKTPALPSFYFFFKLFYLLFRSRPFSWSYKWALT